MAGGRRHKSIRATKGQMTYLRDLVKDDIEFTSLTNDEMNQAEALLERIETQLDNWSGEEAL
jgi:hypothetical protein